MADPSFSQAALMSQHWEAVLSYAELCTAAPEEAPFLAAEAFPRAVREHQPLHGPHFAWRPRLLVAVRDAAAQREAQGTGGSLHPALRSWLYAEADAKARGRQRVARGGFEDLPEQDKWLLWHADVELRPTTETALLVGLDPARAGTEVMRARELFREACLRAHVLGLADNECRGYARLLDVATRTPQSVTPGDLQQHLHRCPECSQAAACLSLHAGGLPRALAEGVLGWEGSAYLVKRRAAAAETAVGVPKARFRYTQGTGAQARSSRRVLTAAALAVPVAAVLITLVGVPGGSASTGAVGTYPASAQTSAQTSAPQSGTAATGSHSAVPAADDPGSPVPSGSGRDKPSAQLSGSATRIASRQTTDAPASASPTASANDGAAACTAKYTLVNQWNTGFQAEIEITPRMALNGWEVHWDFPDGQRVTQMWNGEFTQSGSRVTVTQASYNAAVAGGQPISFGFLGTWSKSNSAPSTFSLGSSSCDG
jgi:hypothetical protein